MFHKETDKKAACAGQAATKLNNEMSHDMSDIETKT
ncbi:hypothetical protein B0I21_103469 [Sphingobacterium paludis]|uniref:Uncharacterized protein n=1 Tax=Sphingobacterium paludis TaxID=1476465 RepID=A0A4R7D3F4_9SPHI|nr:hypothetical protein B0I21_103469 [Sphingobacterium paludis]